MNCLTCGQHRDANVHLSQYNYHGHHDYIECYRVYYTNFEYYKDQDFHSLQDAIAAGKNTCFTFAVHACAGKKVVKVVCGWDSIGGLRVY